jgi:hypothetical protein
MKKIFFLLTSALLWGVTCQSKLTDEPKRPETSEEVTLPEAPEEEPVIEPVMTLYDKPFSTIQKVIEGKWRVYFTFGSGFEYHTTYPENTYIEFGNDSYINDDKGNRDTVYFAWEKHQIKDIRNPLQGHEAYMMCDKRNDYINNKWFCRSINNDTLYVEHFYTPTGKTLVRVKSETPEEPITGDEIYVKTGVLQNVTGLFWIYAECAGYEISIDNKSYKPDTLPDEFLPHIQNERNVQVKVTYRISDKKHVCGTGIPGESLKREMPIIHIIKIEKLGAEQGEGTGLKGTTWKLKGFVDVETGNLKVAEPNDPKCYILTFDTDSTYTGISSTNHIYGEYRVDYEKSTIDIVNPMGTEISELFDGLMYMQSFMSVQSFLISGKELRLYYNAGKNYLLFKTKES